MPILAVLPCGCPCIVESLIEVLSTVSSPAYYFLHHNTAFELFIYLICGLPFIFTPLTLNTAIFFLNTYSSILSVCLNH